MVLLALCLLNDRYARASADTKLFEAQALDDRMQWPKTEILVGEALASLPGDSRTEMVAGQIYAMRFVSSHDPAAYTRSRDLLESSYKHNHFDRLRLINIVGLESLALERGQIGSASDFAQSAIGTLAKTDGDNPYFHELKARFFAAQGRFSEALMAMREARRLAPKEERFRSFEAEYEAELH